MLRSENISHVSHYQARYGVSLVRTLEIIDHVIMEFELVIMFCFIKWKCYIILRCH